jgi:hypothetical protein
VGIRSKITFAAYTTPCGACRRVLPRIASLTNRCARLRLKLACRAWFAADLALLSLMVAWGAGDGFLCASSGNACSLRAHKACCSTHATGVRIESPDRADSRRVARAARLAEMPAQARSGTIAIHLPRRGAETPGGARLRLRSAKGACVAQRANMAPGGGTKAIRA